jgi:hypothetical protein
VTIGATMNNFMAANDAAGLDTLLGKSLALKNVKHLYLTDVDGKITRSSSKDTDGWATGDGQSRSGRRT